MIVFDVAKTNDALEIKSFGSEYFFMHRITLSISLQKMLRYQDEADMGTLIGKRQYSFVYVYVVEFFTQKKCSATLILHL